MNETLSMATLVDLVIAITLLECGVLVAYRRSTGKGVAWRDFAVNMVSGLCLMLALRCMAVDAGNMSVAAFLGLAGAAHFTDIAMRWRRAVPASRASTCTSTTNHSSSTSARASTRASGKGAVA